MPQRYAPRPADGVPVRVEGTANAPASVPMKAGTPTDADVVNGAQDGDMIGDSSATKLWIRIAGTWRFVTLT